MEFESDVPLAGLMVVRLACNLVGDSVGDLVVWWAAMTDDLMVCKMEERWAVTMANVMAVTMVVKMDGLQVEMTEWSMASLMAGKMVVARVVGTVVMSGLPKVVLSVGARVSWKAGARVAEKAVKTAFDLVEQRVEKKDKKMEKELVELWAVLKVGRMAGGMVVAKGHTKVARSALSMVVSMGEQMVDAKVGWTVLKSAVAMGDELVARQAEQSAELMDASLVVLSVAM